MGRKVLIVTGVLFLLHTKTFSQDYFSYGGGNFCGVNQVISNPAAAADNRLKLDVTFGFDLNVNNSWFAIKRAALTTTGSITKPGSLQFPGTWYNETPNVPDNIFKNFNVLNSINTHAIILENRVLLPSVLFQLDSKNSFAFTWSIRQMANIDGISGQLAYLFEKELDLNVTQNNRVQNRNMSMIQMSWVEYGFTYARVLKDDNEHFFKAGITPKFLQGLESGYFVMDNLDFLLSTKDTSSYFKMKVDYAHSDNYESPFKKDRSEGKFYRFVSKPGFGLDLGIIYEWRPNYRNYKNNPGSDRGNDKDSWRNDLNKYKIKFGISAVDIGKIKFDKDGKYYDLDVLIENKDIRKITTLANLTRIDSLLRADYASQNQQSQYSIMLPTAINTQLDFSFNQFFYLNLSTHITNFSSSNSYRVHNYTSVCFAPRIEHYWFNISVPFTYNALSADRFKYITTGLNVRLGPLNFGTNNFMPFFKGDVSSFNFFALLKLAIPYKHIKDRDHDGLHDKKDDCPDDPGEIALKGCPDADKDDIPDKDDGCPHQAGIQVFRGCPDTDGDGIRDAEDACPLEKGSAAFKGCPDLDGDSIIDKEDKCPEVKGTKLLKGCPDTDKDNIIDKEDICPDLPGPVENKGCPWPDTDKDGFIDKLDSCIDIPGIAAFKGCPEPAKLALVEKRVLEKAFSNLKFETAKDVIKPASFPYLNALAKLLLGHKTEWKLKLSGHTDNEGTETGNLILSEKRVKSIQNYLVKRGLPKENMILEWFGQSKPVADNLTKEGKQKNRRVEMTVLMMTD